MENQIIALSYGPDEKPLARTDVMNYFAEYGFQPSEDDTGFMNYGPHKETVFIFNICHTNSDINLLCRLVRLVIRLCWLNHSTSNLIRLKLLMIIVDRNIMSLS